MPCGCTNHDATYSPLTVHHSSFFCSPFTTHRSYMANTLCKAERLNSKILIEKMFSGGSRSFSIFPLRVVYLPLEEQREAPVSVLVSVSKKRFKRAVKRNRVKRQVREAYRKNKHDLCTLFNEKQQSLAVAFIYLSDQLVASAEIEEKMKTLLARIAEKSV